MGPLQFFSLYFEILRLSFLLWKQCLVLHSTIRELLVVRINLENQVVIGRKRAR